jgi:hypothetical protein
LIVPIRNRKLDRGTMYSSNDDHNYLFYLKKIKRIPIY